MYLFVRPRWYYLVDVLDAYSRFLVHWTLNTTMLADTVTMTMQTALESLSGRLPGEPRIVHDHGVQFLSQEWRSFVEGAGVTDIKTRVAHPESNGWLERLHRTHREEGLAGELLSRLLPGTRRADGVGHVLQSRAATLGAPLPVSGRLLPARSAACVWLNGNGSCSRQPSGVPSYWRSLCEC